MNAFKLHLVRVKRERRDKLTHVHQRHQRNVKPNQAIVVILTYVLELFLMVCVLEDKITSAAQGCHSRRTSVQLLEEHVGIFVDVRGWGRFYMVIVLLSTILSNAVYPLIL